MATRKSRNTNLKTDLRPTLTDRVKGRVAEAELYFDQRSHEGTSKRRHLRPTTLTQSGGSLADASRAHREIQSLGRVYGEMRTLYRSYRRETGKPAVPELRSAVQAFRRGRSLTSLVRIASFLDDRKLLGW